MAARIPKSKRDPEKDFYEFEVELEDGEWATYKLTPLKYLPVAAAELFEAGREVAGVMIACTTDEARNAIRVMDSEQFEYLMKDWQKASKVEAGESSASSGS